MAVLHPDNIQATAAVLSVTAAAVAIWATFGAQALAHRQQERYRILRTLMEHRGFEISAPEPVAAINMVIVAFAKDGKVQRALRAFLDVANGPEYATARIHCYLDLTAAIANALGFRGFDRARIDEGYFPAR